MKFKMNTILICIIFLLLGILLASIIFPNKCVEGQSNPGCENIIRSAVDLNYRSEYSTGTECADAINKSGESCMVNNLVDQNKLITAFSTSTYCTVDQFADKCTEAIGNLRRCQDDTNSQNQQQTADTDTDTDYEDVYSFCEGSIKTRTPSGGGAPEKAVSPVCMNRLYGLWEEKVKNGPTGARKGNFCSLVERINNADSGNPVYFTSINISPTPQAEDLNQFGRYFLEPSAGGLCNISYSATDSGESDDNGLSETAPGGEGGPSVNDEDGDTSGYNLSIPSTIS